MVVWLRPEYILAFVTSLYYCSQLVLSKTYDKFWCATEEGQHQLFCPDETALLTDITIRKIYRRTEMCEPDDHSEYLVHCESPMDGSLCEGNKTCTIDISSRDYIRCGDKKYAPTYFFVKYTCTQIHTMCTDTEPIRNTLYGYIVSPAYPHPMADNLKCSITIETDPSMFIEISPIQIHLQEASKCRSEYIQILGYDSSIDENNSNKNPDWKAYHTWCGADRSLNNPLSNARYLMSSNSLYISLKTAVSKKSRYFKIRYKVVPSVGRSQYNSDGIAFDTVAKGHVQTLTSTMIIPTTIVIPLLNNSDVRNFNGTIPKRTAKKQILIGIICGIIALLLAIIVGVLIFIFMKRRRSLPSSNTGKKAAPSTPSNTTSKSTAKSPDKAPLLEQTNNTSTTAVAATTAKRKLVPERTVQISDASTSRFKSGESTGTKPEPSASKQTLTAADSGIYGADTADSGIYGADLAEDSTTPAKPVPPSPPKNYGVDLPDVSEPVPTIIVNPLTENSTVSAIVPSNIIEQTPPLTIENHEKETPLDNTIRSAYPGLIDATTSENEGTICGSALQSRRTSSTKSPLIIQESTNLETIVITEYPESSSSHTTIPFNPLHVILKKDANKYYTTEFI